MEPALDIVNACSAKIATYRGLAYACLALTFINAFVIRSAIRNANKRDPRAFARVLLKVSGYLFVTGLVKILLGIGLATVLNPADCTGYIATYPWIAIGLGLWWCLFAGRQRSRAQKLALAGASSAPVATAFATPAVATAFATPAVAPAVATAYMPPAPNAPLLPKPVVMQP
jgi:hypothetical protein